MAPRTFQTGYSGLVSLVRRINSGSIAEEEIDHQITAWVDESCGYTVTMAMATIFALRAEVAEKGPGSWGEVRNTLLVLQDIERRLVGFGEDPETSELKEVPNHPELAKAEPTMRSFVMGECGVLVSNNPQQGLVISVSHPVRFPSVKELIRAQSLSPDRTQDLFAYFPGQGKTFGVSGYTIMLAADPRRAGLL